MSKHREAQEVLAWRVLDIRGICDYGPFNRLVANTQFQFLRIDNKLHSCFIIILQYLQKILDSVRSLKQNKKNRPNVPERQKKRIVDQYDNLFG